MGRAYLPCHHSIGRAFSYPGIAFPEAVQVIQTYPPNPPAPPEMFDPTGVPMYFEEIINSSVPGCGPIIRWRRDWVGESWCECLGPSSPPCPFFGNFRYQIQFWPENVDPEGDPPRAAVIAHSWTVTMGGPVPSFPWQYHQRFATLLGQTNPVGWELELFSLGVASPPCALGKWAGGWLSVDVGPCNWSQVSEPMTYAESSPHFFWVP